MAINLAAGDAVGGFAVLDKPQEALLIVTERGYGKRVRLSNCPLEPKGGKGSLLFKSGSTQVGAVAAVHVVSGEETLVLVSRKRRVVALPVKDIPLEKKNTKGGHLLLDDLGTQDEIVATVVVR